jgi:triosephosphate isomerase
MAAVTKGDARIPLIAGNWKLNLDHLQSIAFVQKLAWTLQDARLDFRAVEVAVFPPFTDLRSVQTLVEADRLPVRFGAQDVSEHDSGAYTGEISGAFLKALDCSYAIVGHSERRAYHHETNEVVGAKAAAALRHGIVPVICVGETAEDLEARGASAVPVEQLEAALTVLTSGALAPGVEIVVAYEPVWAIGSGQAATPGQAEEVAGRLREVVGAGLGADASAATRILYGGSVNSGNIASFLREADIDGALVGGASLKVDEFAKIARFQSHVGV